MSRPPKPIDWKRVDELLMAGCLGTEIAANFDMHPDTFYNRVSEKYSMGFTEYSTEKRAAGNSIIRAVQFDEAVRKRDRGMLIWLGKNRLCQSDRDEISHKGNIPIEVVNFGNIPIKPWENKESKKIEDDK